MKKKLGLPFLVSIFALFLSMSGCVSAEGDPLFLPQVNLLSPANRSSGWEGGVTLRWDTTPADQAKRRTRETTFQEFQVFLARSTSPFTDPIGTTTGKSYEAGSLEPGTTYKWKVQGILGNGQQATSQEWTFSTKSTTPSYALIYNGVVAAEECPEAAATVAQLAGLPVEFISDLSELPEKLTNAAVFIVGGTEDNLDPLIDAFTPAVDQAFKQWLHDGGRYLGICGGGFLASKGWWEWGGYVNMLGIIPADSDDFLSHSRPVILPIQWLGEVRPMYFQAGPKFLLENTSEQVQIIARYMDDQIAALIATYGNGKVAVSGPHPEAPRSWSYETDNPEDWVSSIDLAVALLQDLLSDQPLTPLQKP
ncbi:MAG TPA: hypothetical protein P5560_13790 [Thermotogota bacterium]|nr:hypothetical protein [Thermotogota bacterium]HRW94020.1 hypothetical protein [Thermotogota bacterium]